MPALMQLRDGSNVNISLHSPYYCLQFIAEIVDKRTKIKHDLNVYVFFDVFDENKKLITEGYKIHKRVNIIPLTQKDENGTALMGED